MSSIDPTPRSGPSPAYERLDTAASPGPKAGPMPVPASAGREHVADLGDYITLGIGLAGVGALGFAVAGASEGLAIGGASLLRSASVAAKEYGPRVAENWKAGAEHLKDAASFGKFAADQTTAGAADFARSAAIGGGLSAGAALARQAVHELAPKQPPANDAANCRLEP